jgi:hypothetical protein
MTFEFCGLPLVVPMLEVVVLVLVQGLVLFLLVALVVARLRLLLVQVVMAAVGLQWWRFGRLRY